MRNSLILVTAVLAGCSSSDADRPIELGHVHPADRDAGAYKALDLAVAELNADPARRPLGRSVRIRHAPGGPKAEEWGGQAARLVALNGVAGLIGGNRPEQADRIGLAVAGENVIAISPAGFAGASASPNLFTVGVAPGERGRALARYAIEQKVKSVAVVRDPAATAANRAADQFVADVRAAGIAVVDPARTDPPTDAAALFFATPIGPALESSSQKAKVRLFGGGEAQAADLAAAGETADGFVVATAGTPEVKTESMTAFVRRYQEKYGHPPTTASILAHDALSIWLEAVRRAKSLDADKIRDQLLRRDEPFVSLTGPLSFSDDHTARRSAFVGTVRGGKIDSLRSYDPPPAR